MKQRTPEELFIRKLLAENIICRRKRAKEIRDYAFYDLSKRTIGSICGNTEYLKILTKRMENLELEYSLLYNIYIKSI